MDNSAFTPNLIKWYEKSERDLPWRKTVDPYKIWLSEVILQQTRVSQGMPYYYKFIETFPTLKMLADASEEEVLRIWQGLGYYSRARNLHKCAKIVSQNFGGKFPPSHDELKKLPGIGPYTAAAIASFAFHLPHAVMDGNVQRVLARYLGIGENIADAKIQRKIQQAVDEMIDKKRPATFNQAIMDLGATVCVPGKPLCERCPVNDSCYAMHHMMQEKLPIKLNKTKRRARYFYYWVLRYNDHYAFYKREEGDIWRGLYEFIMTEQEKKGNWEEMLGGYFKNVLNGETVIRDVIELKKHVLSHQDIHPTFVLIDLDEQQFNNLKLNYLYQFYSLDQILQLPKPILIDKFLREKII